VRPTSAAKAIFGKSLKLTPPSSGATVLTTCSPHNFQLVKSLGATEAFSYKDSDVSKKIRDYTNGQLTVAFDTISEGNSMKICEEAISSKGGKISYLLQAKHSREDVENLFTLAYTMVGEEFQFRAGDVPAKKEDLEFGKVSGSSLSRYGQCCQKVDADDTYALTEILGGLTDTV
jgi:threonine dehydrogenase-like Zn-dependent dehydrogenase